VWRGGGVSGTLRVAAHPLDLHCNKAAEDVKLCSTPKTRERPGTAKERWDREYMSNAESEQNASERKGG